MAGLAAGAAAYLGGAAEGKTRREEDQAAADERAQERAERHGEFEQEFGLEQSRTQSQLLTDAQQRDIAKETQGWARDAEPYVLQAKRAAAQLADKQVINADDEHAINQLVKSLDQLKLKIEQQYGPKMAQAAYDQAVASVGLTNAQIDEARAYAQRAREGPLGGSGAASKGYPDGLSPTGQAFYDTLYNTNNPPTAQQALIAINNPSNRLDQNDRRILQANVLSSRSGLPTPVSQGKLAASRAPLAGLGLDQHHQTLLLRVLDKIDAAPNRAAAAAAYVEDATNGSGKGKVPPNVIDFVRQYGQDEAHGGSESQTFNAPQPASLPGAVAPPKLQPGGGLNAIPGAIKAIPGAAKAFWNQPASKPPGVPADAVKGVLPGVGPVWASGNRAWDMGGQEVQWQK